MTASLTLPLCAGFRLTNTCLNFLGIYGLASHLNFYPTLTFLSRATDLGVQSWYADELGPEEVISLSQLTGHFILARLEVQRIELWITVAFDHV